MASATIDRISVLIGGDLYDFPSATVPLSEGKNTVFATASGVSAVTGDVLRDTTTVPLWQLTIFNGVLAGFVDLRPIGGIGNANLKSAPASSTVTISGVAVSVAAEGQTLAVATVSGTLAGVSFDDTIHTIEATWSIAGQNKWHPSIPVVHAPGSGDVTANIHGLSPGQAYDLAFIVRDHAGNVVGGAPVLASTGGSSPSITASQISNALNLDQISDGLTYGRTWLSRLSGGKPWIDFSESIHANKHLGNIPDDPGSSRYAVLAVDPNRRPIVDFTQNAHVGKILDNIADGLTYGRPLIARLSGGKPWIDFSENIHANKVLDNIGDGLTYGRPLLSRLSIGKPWIDFSETIHANKHLGYIPDDAGSSRYAVLSVDANRRPIIDFTQSAHVGKILDNISDGSTYARVKSTELAAGTVKQINDGTNVRTAANIANAITGGGFVNLPQSSGNVPYANTSVEYQGNFYNDGSAKTSSMLRAYIPNALANVLSDVKMSYSSTTTSISIWMVSYSGNSQNPNGSGLPCFQFPDGTLNYPTSANSGSSSSPLTTFSGLSSSTAYYILAKYNIASETFTASIYSTQAAAIAAQNSFTGDGQIIGVVTSADTAAAITPTAGGTGSTGGGTGGGGGYPKQ